MSDAELRACERELDFDPVNLELRLRHARLLQREDAGTAALDALDLAWRLGANEVYEELSALLEAQTIRLEVCELRYVPGGPFVMGADDFDADASPPHLVQLSPFWITREVLSYDILDGYRGSDEWMLRLGEPQYRTYWTHAPFHGTWEQMDEALRHMGEVHGPPGLKGGYALPSEAQWERATRAALLRPDGRNPYGLEADSGPQWVRDYYDPNYYERSPSFDPQGPAAGKERVVRGVFEVPASHYAIYREAADAAGEFRVQGGLTRMGFGRRVRYEGVIASRAVFQCA